MIVLTLDNFESQNIHFGPPLKNNIINNGSFSHINYSTHYFSLNTIYIQIPLKLEHVLQTNKMKLFFKKNNNQEIINKLKILEHDILETKTKTKQYKINSFLENENIIHAEYAKNFIILLKISGLWETDQQCGLSFKFIIHPLKN
jgi:hypothetical protein